MYRVSDRAVPSHITRFSRDLCAVMSTRFQRDIVTCGYYILYTVGFASYRTNTAGWYPQTLQVESVGTTDLNHMCFKSAVLTSTDTKWNAKQNDAIFFAPPFISNRIKLLQGTEHTNKQKLPVVYSCGKCVGKYWWGKHLLAPVIALSSDACTIVQPLWTV